MNTKMKIGLWLGLASGFELRLGALGGSVMIREFGVDGRQQVLGITVQGKVRVKGAIRIRVRSRVSLGFDEG